MMHQVRFILVSSLLLSAAVASEKAPKSESSAKLSSASEDVSNAALPFETSHKIHHEFHTSHKISPDAFQRRDDLHQSMRSKEKPELDEELAELIAADIKNNIEAKRLSEYEKYVIEPLTTEKPNVAQSVNEGLIDDEEFSLLEEAGTENKQQSRIQIKKGPNGQDYEYEYVYYYYDDDENKNPGDSDVIVANRKPPSPATTSTAAPTTTQAAAVGGAKIRYSSVERGAERAGNDIQTRGKARAVVPAPVVEEIVDERLPPATRFPQRVKAAVVESAAPAQLESVGGKKHHPKRPSLELVDSHIFLTDEKNKNSQKEQRIIETENNKSEFFESVSRQSIEYASSTTESFLQSLEEDTTPLMEKVAFDLYAHIVNENAKEEDKKSIPSELEVTTADGDELTTIDDEITTIAVPTTSSSTTSTTTTTTPAPTTTTTTTTTEAPIVAKGRGGLTAGRTSNRFKFQGKGLTTTTEAPAESTSAKSRFNRPSFGGSSSSRTNASRFSKTTPAAAAAVAEKEENVEKSEAPQVTSSNKFKSSPARNRFNLRGSTEKSLEGNDAESTTASRLVRPSRPQFSLRNRGRPSAAAASTTETSSATETPNAEEPENNAEKSTEKSAIAARPTSRLNINRPANRANAAAPSPVNKVRPSPLIRSRTNASESGSEGNNKSAYENESDPEATTQNNLNKLKSRPRIQINAESKAKKTTAAPVINRKANPLISKRKFGASTTEATADEQVEHESDNAAKDGANDSEEHKDEETTQPTEVTSEQPARGGLGLLNRRKLVNNRRPGQIN